MDTENAPTARAQPRRASRRPAPGAARAARELVSLELTEAQVERVISANAEAHGPSLSLLLSGLVAEQALSASSLEERYYTELESGRLSHSLFRGLLILALFISGEEGARRRRSRAAARFEPEHDASLHDDARGFWAARARARDPQVPAPALNGRPVFGWACGTQRRRAPALSRRSNGAAASPPGSARWIVRDNRAYASRQAERARCSPQGLRGRSWRCRRGSPRGGGGL